MKNLQLMLEKLGQEHHDSDQIYIPSIWNCTGFTEYNEDPKRPGELLLNPYRFISHCIGRKILPQAKGDDLTPLGMRKPGDTIEPSRNVIYSVLPRMFTAWEHREQGEIYPGTFLKAICLLPYLKRLHVNTVYLLPIFEYSNKYLKGTLGSPYAIKNIYRIDPKLHDPLLGTSESDASLADMEFKAFVEACHILNIRVMVDFVFRTVSRDNDLLIEHPEWFYWIYANRAAAFTIPDIKTSKAHIPLNDRTLKELYHATGIGDYLGAFTQPPNEYDPKAWAEIIHNYHRSGGNILELIEERMGITTVPGFSDVLNDPQPPWTDVTYLKFYYDNHPKVKPFLPPDQPPYILHDGVSLNMYHGARPNRELWSYIAGVIPYYQEYFGIDGARIDMGHALPLELNREIVARVKEQDPGFVLWSEEFNIAKSQVAKKDGFHFISGFTWGIYKGFDQPDFNKRLFQDTLLHSELPITAALETPDTPRLSLVVRDRRKIAQMVWINFLLPNTVSLVNNGLEVMEVQPMNLGLDNTEAGQFVLPEDDRFYGKLAFFDPFVLHWLNEGSHWMLGLLQYVLGVREQFENLVSRREAFWMPGFQLRNKKRQTLFGYQDTGSSRNLFLFANRDFESKARYRLADLLPKEWTAKGARARILYAGDGPCNIQWEIESLCWAAPGEVIVGYIENKGARSSWEMNRLNCLE